MLNRADPAELDPDRAARAAAALSEGRARFERTQDGFRVPSFSGRDAIYRVDPERGRCTCPDARIRGTICKHQLALLLRGSAAGRDR